MRGEKCAAHSSQDGACGGFGFQGARQQMQSGNGFGFKTSQAGHCAFEAGEAVEGADGLQRRTAVENGDGLHGEIGAQAQKGLGGELLGVCAGVEVGGHAVASL